MNRSQLIESLKTGCDLTQAEAEWLVRHFFDIIAEGLVRDGRVELRGLGVFKLSDRNQAGFQNPRDGRYYGGLPLKTIKFYPSLALD